MEEKEKEMELTPPPANTTGGTSHMAEYQSNIKLFDEIENFLLGSFDNSGKYSLTAEMVDELIKMKKIYSYAFGEIIFCESEILFENVGHIQFTVKIEQNKDEMSAKLMLVQEVKRANGMLKKNAITELSTYKATNSPTFINDCFAKFNIYSKKEDGLQKKEFENEEVSMVRDRLKYLNGRRMLLDEKDELFKELVEKKLALLAKYGVGKKIVAEYNAMLQKGKFNKLARGYYRHMNSILDNIMEKHKTELLKDPFFVAQWGKLNSNISSKIRKEVNNPLKLTVQEKEKIAAEKMAEKPKETKPKEEKKPTADKAPKPEKPKAPKPSAPKPSKPSDKAKDSDGIVPPRKSPKGPLKFPPKEMLESKLPNANELQELMRVAEEDANKDAELLFTENLDEYKQNKEAKELDQTGEKDVQDDKKVLDEIPETSKLKEDEEIMVQ